MVGRILQVTPDESRRIVSPGLDPTQRTREEMDQWGICEENLYVHSSEIDESVDVWRLMQSRRYDLYTFVTSYNRGPRETDK